MERRLFADGMSLAVRDQPGLVEMPPTQLDCIAELLLAEYGTSPLVRGYAAGVRIISAAQRDRALDLERVS